VLYPLVFNIAAVICGLIWTAVILALFDHIGEQVILPFGRKDMAGSLVRIEKAECVIEVKPECANHGLCQAIEAERFGDLDGPGNIPVPE